MHCGYFDTTRYHSAFLTPIVVGGRRPLFLLKFALKAYNVSTVRDSEKKLNYDEYKVDHGLSNEL